MALLAVLLALIYGYWSLTNDSAVRDLSQRYLQSLTGGRVKVHHATFRLLEGIDLDHVSMFLPKEDSPDPFFSARSITLAYNPWAMLAGDIESSEIICRGARSPSNAICGRAS